MTIDRWPQAQAARGRAHAAPLQCRAAQVSSVTCPALAWPTLACPGLHLSVPCRPCCQSASVTSTGEECQFSPAADFTRCQAGSTGEGPPPVQCSVVLGPAWGDLDPRPPGHTGQGPALHCVTTLQCTVSQDCTTHPPAPNCSTAASGYLGSESPEAQAGRVGPA